MINKEKLEQSSSKLRFRKFLIDKFSSARFNDTYNGEFEEFISGYYEEETEEYVQNKIVVDKWLDSFIDEIESGGFLEK